MYFWFSHWIKIYLGTRFFYFASFRNKFYFHFYAFSIGKYSLYYCLFFKLSMMDIVIYTSDFLSGKKDIHIPAGTAAGRLTSVTRIPRELLPLKHSPTQLDTPFPGAPTFNPRSIFPNSQLCYCLSPVLPPFLPFHRCWTP